MTEDRPDRPAGFVGLLEVPRNAKLGLLAGVAVALFAFALIYGRPLAYHPLLYVGLGLVIVVTTALLVTTLLVALTAARRAGEEP